MMLYVQQLPSGFSCFCELNRRSGNQILQSDEVGMTSIMKNDQAIFSNIKLSEYRHIYLKCSAAGMM